MSRGSAETTGPRIRTSRHDGGSGSCSDSSRPASRSPEIAPKTEGVGNMAAELGMIVVAG